jgi:hypothetical protein
MNLWFKIYREFLYIDLQCVGGELIVGQARYIACMLDLLHSLPPQ